MRPESRPRKRKYNSNRGRGRRHHSSKRRTGRYHRNMGTPRRKTGGIFGFLKRLFGLGKKRGGSQRRQSRHRIPERERFEFSRAASLSRSVDEGLQELHTPKLYVGNLSYETSESDLFDLFSQTGAVSNVEIVRDRQMNSKGFGFVEMQGVETAKNVIERHNGIEFMGRNLVISPAKS